MDAQAVLFDFDFTLADPRAWLIPAWAEALAAIGEGRPDDATLEKVVGKPLRAQYSIIVGEDASGARFETFERSYRRHRDRHAPKETRMVPGVAAILEALRKRRIILGIVSTGAAIRLKAILDRTALDRYFQVLEAGWKDKAVGISAALKSLKVEAAYAVYVGDHPEDCRAARQAGVGFLAVKTGVHTEADFPEGTVVLASVADLPGQLSSAR